MFAVTFLAGGSKQGVLVDVFGLSEATFALTLTFAKILCLDTNYPPMDGNDDGTTKPTGWCHTNAPI